MTTYAAALAYRGLFGLFPFVLIVVVLVGVLGFPDSFERLIEQARSGSSRQVPQQLEPMVEQGREHIQPLGRMIEQAEEQAGGELLFFGIVVALWSTSALARTLTEAFNAAYQVTETRAGWKRLVISWAFGPVLALMVITQEPRQEHHAHSLDEPLWDGRGDVHTRRNRLRGLRGLRGLRRALSSPDAF